MPSLLHALCFDANDPRRLARFWAGVLDWEMTDDPNGGITLLPNDDTGFRLRFLPSEEQKTGPNRMHFDLTSTSLEDQQNTVARSLELGARHIDIGQGPDAEHVVLADPEGNEFDVIEPGNNFLADCGFIGALACDGSQEVGYFWSEALGWPLVWDQDQETAIRSPQGGPKTRGAVHLWRRRQARTGCTSTSPLPSTATSKPRSTVWSPSERLGWTSAKAIPAGCSWSIPMGTSSVC